MNKLTLTSALLWLIAGAAVSAHNPVQSGYAPSQLNAATSQGACRLIENNGNTTDLNPAQKSDTTLTGNAPAASVLLKCMGMAATDIRVKYSPAPVPPHLLPLASTSSHAGTVAVKMDYDETDALTDVGLTQPVIIKALPGRTNAGGTELPLNVYATLTTDFDMSAATLPLEIEYK